MSSEELFVDTSQNDEDNWEEFSETVDSVSSESREGDLNLSKLGSHNPSPQNSRLQYNDLKIFKTTTSYSDQKKNISRGMS